MMKRNDSLLERAACAWESLAAFRAKRERLKRYTFGDQWHDPVEDFEGNILPEAELMMSTGKRPVTVNMLRRLVRILVGRFRTDAAAAGTYDLQPGSADARNALPELDARMLEEFIISGCAVQHVVAERRPGGTGVWIDNVAPGDFFVNRFSDPRGADIELAGMYHRMSWPRLLNRFGRGSAARCRALREVFAAHAEHDGAWDGCEGRLRVAEVWTLDATPDTKRRARYEMGWRCRFLAPDATVLADMASPYPHRGHPFAVKFYPLVDGEIHSFIEDLVERQRAINRMLTTFEATMAASAKGALIFPIDQLVKGYTYEDIGALWARPDSVIPVNGRNHMLPQQIITNNTAGGIVPIIEMQTRLLEEASGLSDALLGRGIPGSMGSELYRSVMANSAASIADVLDTFRSFLTARNALAQASV